jgi:hypothetical protein
MQVLVLVVLNSVDFSDLGVATSGTTLFRLIGGALGTAVFGTVFSNGLTSQLAGKVPTAGQQNGRLSPAQLAKLPAAAHTAYTTAFVNALHPVFLMAAGVSAVAFVLSLWIPDRTLRDTVEASGAQGHFAIPRADDRTAEIERALSVLASRDTRRRFYERLLAELGIELSPLEAWTLARVEDGIPGPPESLASRLRIEPERISGALTDLEQRALISPENGWYAATPAVARSSPGWCRPAASGSPRGSPTGHPRSTRNWRRYCKVSPRICYQSHRRCSYQQLDPDTIPGEGRRGRPNCMRALTSWEPPTFVLDVQLRLVLEPLLILSRVDAVDRADLDA